MGRGDELEGEASHGALGLSEHRKPWNGQWELEISLPFTTQIECFTLDEQEWVSEAYRNDERGNHHCRFSLVEN